MKRYLVIILLFLIASGVHSQVFPVRTITSVAAPYPTSLEQFTNIENGHISLTIIPNDVSLHNYPIKLRLAIAGGSFKIYTDPNYIHKNIILNNGEAQTFSGPELAEWFNIDHLIFEGISKNQYLKTGRLPEGICQVWFETYDFYRNFNISSTSKAMIWMTENDPPQLNFPTNTIELPASDPQNIVFNWTQRQSPFSIAGSGNEFTFEIWELCPESLNADEVSRSMRPFYQIPVTSSTLSYTADAPILVPGRKYAWRITVKDPTGRNRYKNDGYSEVRWFRFGKICEVPVPLADKIAPTSLGVKWEANIMYDKFELRYRNKNSKDANWYSKDASGSSVTIEGLQPNSEYEIQLHGFCGGQEGNYSSSLTMRTKQETTTTCGAAPGTNDLSNKTPLPALKAGDFIHVSDFDVQIYQVSGGAGTFSGKCFVQIPLLKFVKFDAAFTGIQVNTDYRMLAGKIDLIYNSKNGLVANIGAFIDSLIKKNPNEPIEKNPYIKTADKTSNISGDIDNISFNSNGDIIIHTADGKSVPPIRTQPNDLVAIQGSSPDAQQYVADTKSQTMYTAKPETVGNSGGQNKPKQPEDGAHSAFTVTFTPHPFQTYGLDVYNDKAPTENYQKTNIGGQNYFIPWKSVESGHMDRITAFVSGGKADTINFLTTSGNMAMTAPGQVPSAKQLLITGINTTDEVQAWYSKNESVNDTTKKQNRVLAGQVNISAYTKVLQTVCLVQIGDTPTPDNVSDIKNELNRIYASSIVEWNVLNTKKLTVAYDLNGNNQLDCLGEGDAMGYNDEMKVIINALKNIPDYDSHTLYLCFVDKFTDPNQEGYMPFNRNVGFIFKDKQSPVRIMHDIAHELGHGAFRLRHTFSPDCQFVQSKFGTENLMDYVDSSKLFHYQWEEMREWHLGINWFEDAGEGENKGTKKGTPVAIISDTTMIEGKVFVYNGTSKQIMVKFETSDTSKTKITYKLTTLIETTKTTLTYPKAGYDTLTYNQVKQITLDSIPEGKYTLFCKLGSTEYKTTFYIRKQKFEVTVTQLQSIFTKTDSTRIKEVVKALNENSLLFGINTPERMAHFIGQIGAETGGLKKLKEDCNYTAKNIFNTFLKPNLRTNSASKTGKTFKYCDLVEGYTCTNLNSCDGTNNGHSDCDSALSVKLTKSNTCAWEFANFDSTYNVKSGYISNNTLFDYVYGCRMDNGCKTTQDGSTYLGKGFIHITGKSGYKALSTEWNKLYPDDKKEFHGKDINLLETDVEVAIKASMVFWKLKGLNQKADEGTSQNIVDQIGLIVNGGTNGQDLRRTYTKSASENLK